MAEGDFNWFLLAIFLMIPLMRIIPRLLRRRKMKNIIPSQTFAGGQFEQNNDTMQEHTRNPTIQEYARDPSKPKTKDMIVLGELHGGTKNFEGVKRNTGLDSNELNSILEDLEKRGLIRVEKKQGLLGIKIELYATEKGFRVINFVFQMFYCFPS